MWLSMRTDNFTRLLLKYPEHTWGSAGYVNGGIDVDKWANEQFHEAVVREKRLLGGSHFERNTINVPRQARDKHRKS
jgi:hypothetical protein